MKASLLKSETIKLGITASVFFMAITISSCNNENKTADSKEIAEDHNEAKFDRSEEDDANFLVEAAEINLAEIELGQMANKNSITADVKKLGAMLITEHTKAQNDLTALASKKQISIPTTLTDKGLDEYRELSEKSGSKFDKEYCEMMVKGHKDAIDKFEKASTDAKDADIRAWASLMLPILRSHLDHAINCNTNLN